MIDAQFSDPTEIFYVSEQSSPYAGYSLRDLLGGEAIPDSIQPDAKFSCPMDLDHL